MDFSQFAPMPVVDGHIHFAHPALADDLLAVVEATNLTRVNLVALPDLETVNQNAALVSFKAHHPGRAYTCGALDYVSAWADPGRASQNLAGQIGRLRAIGFDGLKLVEGKPTVRKLVGLPFDGTEYAGMWAALEDLGFPVVWHVADPEEFWDPAKCPDWARAHDWFYADGTFPAKEALYAEVEHVLALHPRLKAVFAHFYFLSADLPRAAAFLEAHPEICLDLTPGIEMYLNFAHDPQASRDFFLRYADRIVYGTDIGAKSVQRDAALGLDWGDSLGRTWLVRRFLEGDKPFGPPAELGHGLGMDAAGMHGIGLPREALERIYHGNFERLFGPVPAALHREAALVELERIAALIDARAGMVTDSDARRVARDLQRST